MEVSMTVNGEQVTRDVEPRLLLVHFMRETLEPHRHPLGLRHVELRRLRRADGRRAGQVVHRSSRRCATGHEIRTVESLEVDGQLDPIQQGFHELHALQCGFCTPGMLMTTRALLDENPDPTDHEIRTAISGAICRCTGYKNIVTAVRWAAEHEAAARQES